LKEVNEDRFLTAARYYSFIILALAQTNSGLLYCPLGYLILIGKLSLTISPNLTLTKENI